MNTFLLISIIALWLALAFVAFLLLGALRSLDLLNWRLAQLEATTPSRIGRSGLKPGKKAPDFTLPSVGGGEVSFRDFAGRKVLLVFVQSGCAPCHDIAPELNRLAARNRDVQVLVVNNAEPEQAREYAREVNARFPVLVQEKWSVSKRYEVFATPFAFLVDERGVVAAKGIVSSKEHLGCLFSSATSRAAATGQAATNHAPAEENGTERGAISQSVSLSPKEVHHV
jgi:methylamine dehydrogenase accessory protein MauD